MAEPIPRVHDFRKESFPPELRLAIVVTKNSQNGLHVGIVFMDDGELKYLHLGWHHRVYYEGTAELMRDSDRLFWIDLEFDKDEEAYLLGRLHVIAERNGNRKPSIPYGLQYTDGRLNAQGIYEPGQDCGLTCATFVLEVFRSGGYPLADASSWKARREDEPHQQGLFDSFRQTCHRFEGFAQHAEKFEKEVKLKCPRFRPEEVAAAGTASNLPADFAYCEQTGLTLRRKFLPEAS